MNHLSQSRPSIIFEREGDSLSILYWGKKIGNLGSDFEKSIEAALSRPSAHGGLDAAVGNLVLRVHSRGWSGHPALRGHRSGVSVANGFTVKSISQKDQTLTVEFEDALAGLEISMTYALTESDILLMDAEVRNVADGDYFLEHFLYWLPLAIS